MQATPQPLTTPLGLPLPDIVHASLPPEEVVGRVIIVGDVHGCLTELKQLLEKVAYRDGADTLIFVGDLGNKGPESAEVVRFVRDGLRARCVRGNHDEQVVHTWRALQAQGGPSSAADLPAGLRWVAGLAPADAAWLAALPFSLALPSHGALVVHAGLLPGVPLASQALADLIDLRTVEEGPGGGGFAALPKHPREAGVPWATRYAGPPHVVFGHHARLRLQERRYATGIDTGCCVGGSLTALVLPPREEVQGAAAAALARGGVTRADLRGELVSVPALRCYKQD